ncbi:hypothetical protein PAAG_11817 [Paracoccidioides lutzii Pb01]|uniref:Uncharacterized protein n=1 Tax=Paracoccidioides lutzii (strain ATCC MYA-826 / Pb01) TaxID=502779 RepID=A0A0A2V522_PARBA|nr:hypothetical protein PAAG_11817 [Paracoccidioides lutzii Pb01]KGQ01467.1 hypothetical protein PAAG_11817 [Paracoccidioides lutzii Pb01]
MTELSIPLTERKQSLQSHSRAVGAFPSLDENEELEGLKQEPSSNHIMDSSSHESDEMSAPESIHEFTAANDFKSQICEYQKNIQRAMDTKVVTIFNDINY